MNVIPVPNELAAILAIFDRSLSNLGIAKARFTALPLQQRRLALEEAIHATTGELTRGMDWTQSRCSLRSMQLTDFSPEEIEQHQRVVDSLLVLACLGEASSIRPLVTYLEFPEARWHIVIESALRSLSERRLRGPVYRVPNHKDRFAWRRWALELPLWAPIRDLSSHVLARLGDAAPEDRADFGWVPTSSAQSTLAFSFGRLTRPHFDTAQARYCQETLFPHLENRSFSRFALRLNEYFEGEPRRWRYDTMVACLKDGFRLAGISHAELSHFLIADVPRNRIRPITWVILCRSLSEESDEGRRAHDFARKLVGERSDPSVLRVFSDVLTGTVTSSSLKGICEFAGDMEHFADEARSAFEQLTAPILDLVRRWLALVYSSELESICLVGGEKAFDFQETLRRTLSRNVLQNSQTCEQLTIAQRSTNEVFRALGQAMEQLATQRLEIADFVFSVGDCRPLALEYTEAWHDWFRNAAAALDEHEEPSRLPQGGSPKTLRLEAEVRLRKDRKQLASGEAADILSLIETGKSKALAFRPSLKRNPRTGAADPEIEDENIRTIAALLNSGGGTLLVGIADDGTLLGYDSDLFDSEEQVKRCILTKAQAALRCSVGQLIEIAVVSVRDTEIVRVDVQASPTPVYVWHSDDERVFYVRGDDVNRRLDVSEARRYMDTRF